MKQFAIKTLLVGALCIAALAALTGNRAVGQQQGMAMPPDGIPIGVNADGGFFAFKNSYGTWYGCKISNSGATACSIGKQN